MFHILFIVSFQACFAYFGMLLDLNELGKMASTCDVVKPLCLLNIFGGGFQVRTVGNGLAGCRIPSSSPLPVIQFRLLLLCLLWPPLELEGTKPCVGDREEGSW